jgi:hypothetical protein
MLKAQIGQLAPPLQVSKWLQGEAIDFSNLRGYVVLIEVFQVNCPGCFLHSLPQAVGLYYRYAQQGLVVAAVATTFEDFDKNTEENLQRLLDEGEVVGETARWLTKYQLLVNGRLGFKIPFPVAMDKLTRRESSAQEREIIAFINQHVPDFQSRSTLEQEQIHLQVKKHLQSLLYRAETFETFDLQGTPSHILVDKQGLLHACRFGEYPELEADIQTLLQR